MLIAVDDTAAKETVAAVVTFGGAVSALDVGGLVRARS